MIISVNLQSDVPIYTQLTNQIIEGIASGRLAPGESLPSVRSLSADLGINMHTVNKAYAALKQDGFVEIHRQKGVVIQHELPIADDAFHASLEEKLRPLVSEAICRKMSEEEMLGLYRKLFRQIHPEAEEDNQKNRSDR